jgi:hypothetical protein
MWNFIKEMFSNNNEVSSKRVASMFVLVNIVILAYIATFRSKDGITPEFMYDALCLIAGGGLGLTVIEKILALKYKGKEESPTDTNKPE